jgi:hypothetical protein
MASGYTNNEIAFILGLGTETVKSHVRHILSRLDARTRAHAVAIAFLKGMLSTTSPIESSGRSDSSLYESENEQKP